MYFSVPQECLDVADNQKIQAAKSDATVEKCEESPDRCFMNNGWTFHNTDHPSSSGPKCFYKKGKPDVFSRGLGGRYCYVWPRQGTAQQGSTVVLSNNQGQENVVKPMQPNLFKNRVQL